MSRMKRITGTRGSGKTTKVIEYAHENNYIMVVPNCRLKDYAIEQARAMKCENVTIIDIYEYMQLPSHERHKYIFDELDHCLSAMNVIGYSVNIDN